METLELPVLEEAEEQTPHPTCAEDPIDLAAFELWRRASTPPGEETA